MEVGAIPSEFLPAQPNTLGGPRGCEVAESPEQKRPNRWDASCAYSLLSGASLVCTVPQ